MKRNKRHKVKIESNENTIPNHSITSTGQDRDLDLAHYIHDRVELLQRAFGAIKPRELKAMTPACVAGLSLDDLQELCLEELLGISSVRLCAILDGAEPPSDTDSSESSEAISAVHLETISLDSISSDEDTLNPPPAAPPQESKSVKHKKRCRRKEARKAKIEVGNDESQSHTHAAERAGMTVLELLELQARARAIRAQLAMEHTHVTTTDTAVRKGDESDNDVQIKEEPPEVVELSSDDESQNHIAQSSACSIANEIHKDKSNKTRSLVQSKDKCELTVIVPNAQSKKIKLKRNKVTATATQEPINVQKSDIHENNISHIVKMKVLESIGDDPVSTLKGNESHDKIGEKDCYDNKKNRMRLNKQKKKKRDKNKPGTNREGSDHDEITLQLSDTEKMDLLEDFDRKNLDNTSSSESDASTDIGLSAETSVTAGSIEFINHHKDSNTNQCDRQLESQLNDFHDANLNNDGEMLYEQSVEVEQIESDNNPLLKKNDVKLCLDPLKEAGIQALELNVHNKNQDSDFDSKNIDEEKKLTKPLNSNENQVNIDHHQEINQVNDMSEGEISDKPSSEVIVKDIDPTVSTIGNETLMDKQEKLNSDGKSKQLNSCNKIMASPVDSGQQNYINDVCEIFEISDDSSYYEEEGVSVLSKEPTTEEIEAFSARIDHEIQREELTTGEEGNKDLENISWKHRYLDSKKVKKIMSTANILNALRKKNKELKRKIEESKNKTDNEVADDIIVSPPVEEGTVDQYNTLEGSTKYVSPPSVTTEDSAKHLHKEMKRDAKQLLKMYKRLLKYNDMQKEPRKSKSKKKKNKKGKEKASHEAPK
ncbi:hypothetical protein EVAR_89319_1 [Eumeta japonica]|uniref:Uncharacterized protein n=1 Tax=Eumeta variegata TaxID=151549 RepID=A0A4C1Z0M1_EUMVA|nr:hypothetical protein EVAR_89319_1 [Eumeta japonica]